MVVWQADALACVGRLKRSCDLCRPGHCKTTQADSRLRQETHHRPVNYSSPPQLVTCNLHSGTRHKQLPEWITWRWRVMILWTRLWYPATCSQPHHRCCRVWMWKWDLTRLLVHWVACAVCQRHCVHSVCHLVGRSVLMPHVVPHAWY